MYFKQFLRTNPTFFLLQAAVLPDKFEALTNRTNRQQQAGRNRLWRCSTCPSKKRFSMNEKGERNEKCYEWSRLGGLAVVKTKLKCGWVTHSLLIVVCSAYFFRLLSVGPRGHMDLWMVLLNQIYDQSLIEFYEWKFISIPTCEPQLGRVGEKARRDGLSTWNFCTNSVR